MASSHVPSAVKGGNNNGRHKRTGRGGRNDRGEKRPKQQQNGELGAYEGIAFYPARPARMGLKTYQYKGVPTPALEFEVVGYAADGVQGIVQTVQFSNVSTKFTHRKLRSIRVSDITILTPKGQISPRIKLLTSRLLNMDKTLHPIKLSMEGKVYNQDNGQTNAAYYRMLGDIRPGDQILISGPIDKLGQPVANNGRELHAVLRLHRPAAQPATLQYTSMDATQQLIILPTPHRTAERFCAWISPRGNPNMGQYVIIKSNKGILYNPGTTVTMDVTGGDELPPATGATTAGGSSIGGRAMDVSEEQLTIPPTAGVNRINLDNTVSAPDFIPGTATGPHLQNQLFTHLPSLPGS